MIVIDSQSRQPIYEQIVEHVESLIAAGVMSQGSSFHLCGHWRWNFLSIRIPSRKHTPILEEHGAIYPVKGKGNFVSEKIR